MSNRPFKKILILCEGVTEQHYALALKSTLTREKQREVDIEVIYDSNNDPLTLAKEATRRANNAKRYGIPYSKVWIFFDNDNAPKLKEAFVEIEKHNHSIAYSSISIEYWFILHFTYTTREFRNADEAIKHLIQNHIPNYHKTKINHYAILKDKLATGLANAIMLRQNVEHQPLHQSNPYVTVDELVNYINNL